MRLRYVTLPNQSLQLRGGGSGVRDEPGAAQLNSTRSAAEARAAEGALMAEMPDGSNFFSTLDTSLSREQVAWLYGAIGWRVRRCSWVDYEVISDWAELVIEAEGLILMHGPVADLPARAEELVAPLQAAGVSFAAECYGPDPDGELLLELRG